MQKCCYNQQYCILGMHFCMDWRSIKFDWNRARAFLVTAEEGSFSAAAKALSTTQPTLGRQVAALEKELGVSLFERTSSGLQLTSNGYELVEYVKAMADAANNFSLVASGRAETLEGSVCISASEAVSAFILPPIIAKLRKQAPGIDVEIIATNDTSDLLRREADIAIRAFCPTQQDLIVKRLKDRKIHLYAAKSYLTELGKVETQQDLKRAHFLGFAKDSQMLSEMKKYGFDADETNFPVYIDNHLVQWELVKQGIGIGFMLEQVGEAEPLVDRVLPKFPAFDMETWLVVHRELNTSRRLRTVFDFLAEELNQP